VRIELVDRPAPVTGDITALSSDERAAREAMPVALVAMPFVTAHRPSIQLGLLKPIAESFGFPTETFHLTVEFADQIGLDLYEQLCEHREALVGDWLFSVAAFGQDAPDPSGKLFLDDFDAQAQRIATQAGGDVARLCEVREVEVPRYIERLIELVDWSRFAIVGFTSTFQQNAASFALAAAIKRRWPHVTTLFGGANFEGAMGHELVRAVDAVDLAVSGEADMAFSQLLVGLSQGADPASVPGVLAHRDGAVAAGGTPPPFERLDELPVPDYQEYFDRAERLGILARTGRRNVALPFESARGCWWGAKRHCTFCGLNGNTMAFRTKQPQRVVDELALLAERHRSFAFVAVDNILEPSYLDDLFPALAATRSTYELFYEVKANLSPAQLRAMRAAGVRHIQPGIESLSSRVLGLMRKGTRASTNVNLLRWARHYDIYVTWNLLWGFPGESEEDYREQADLMRALVHLQAPSGGGRIWMERFSPIFSDREAFPATRVEPNRSYRYVYPSTVDLDEVAYFFDHELEGTLPDDAYHETAKILLAWSDAWRGETRPTLRLWRSPGLIQIDDTRDPESPGTHTFHGRLAALYLACFDQARKPAEAGARAGLPHSTEAVEAALDEFVARGLMMRDGNLFLSLAVPANGAYSDLSTVDSASGEA
jgi:ribosomal peptide maturation radical SAM protein 1